MPRAVPTIAPLEPELSLTPVRKRRTRPSFSPVKTPKVSVPQRSSSAISHGPSTIPQEPILPTAALEFEEFSFVGQNGDIHHGNITHEQYEALHDYLAEHYNVVVIDYSEPYLVLGCDGAIPPEDQRPFSVAGCIAIWKSADEMGDFYPFVGELGQADEVHIDQDMLRKMTWGEMPPDDVILYLANHIFTDCEALSLLWDNLVVELVETNVEDFIQRLQELPMDIADAPFGLRFNNGPLPNTPRRSRVVKPNPSNLDSLVADETDYVQTDGKFYPGAMINSLDESGNIFSSVSAGVLIRKGQQQRLTCSWHNWEEHAEKNPGRFGQTDSEAQSIFRATQGVVDGENTDGKAGTMVGFVRERIGETDIALAQLDHGIVFENKFMEINASAKTFIAAKDQFVGDKYVMDSFATGAQMLVGYGYRVLIERRQSRQSSDHPDLFTATGQHDRSPARKVGYIKARQGVFSTNTPIMTSKPQIRDSACGAVFLRCGYSGKRNVKDTTSEILNRGEVCAMMHYADLQGKYIDFHITGFLIYADSFDPLIEDGWKIVQPDDPKDNQEKRAAAEADLEESPAKKPKVVV